MTVQLFGVGDGGYGSREIVLFPSGLVILSLCYHGYYFSMARRASCDTNKAINTTCSLQVLFLLSEQQYPGIIPRGRP